MFQQVKIKVIFYFVANGTFYSNLFEETRMHSSRMCTVRCSGRREGVYPSMHWAGGVCLEGGVCLGGNVCPGGCLLQCMLGYTPTPVCLPGKVCLPQCIPQRGCLPKCMGYIPC